MCTASIWTSSPEDYTNLDIMIKMLRTRVILSPHARNGMHIKQEMKKKKQKNDTLLTSQRVRARSG